MSSSRLPHGTAQELPGTPPARRGPAWRYLAAVAAIAAAFGVHQALAAWVGPGLPSFILFYPVIIVVALLAGVGPGLLATALTLIVVDLRILPPIGQWSVGTPADRLALALFALNGSLICAVAELYRRSRDRAAAYDREAIRNQAEVMDQAYDALIVRELGGVIRGWNRGAEKLYGWSAVEALGQRTHDLLRTPERAVQTVESALEHIGRWEGELLHTTRDGRSITVEARQTATRTEDGRVLILESNRDITERKRAEDAVRQSQQTLAELIERSPFGTYVVDAQFHIAMMNASSQEGAFRNVRPVIGRDFSEAMGILWPGPVAAEITGHFRHTLDTGEPYYSPRFTNPRHDVAAVESYEWELHRITLPSGQFGVICYYYDSTKLREAENAVRESEERLRFALESCQIGAWDIDLEDQTAFRSLQHDRIFGYHELLPSWTLDDFLRHALPQYRAEVETMVREATAAGTGWTYQCRIRRADGEIRWIWFSGDRRVDSSDRRRVAGVVQDITERKLAEEELRQSEARLRSVLENSRDVIYRLNLQTRRLEYISPSSEAVVGYSPEELMALDDTDAMATIHPDDLPAVEAGRDALAAVGVAEVEYRQRARNGEYRWLSDRMSLTRDAAGEPLYREGNIRDVSERKAAEERARVQASALREADRRKDEFIAILSHELRNPLAPIRYALPLLGEERLGDAGRRATAVIDRQVTHLARLVDDLLDASRITTGKVDLRTDFVTLDAVLSAAVEAASPAIAAAQHSLDVAVPEGPIWLHADPARIAQAVTNLLNNSAKYTPKGGRIRLEAAASETEVTIHVVDNGVGIAPDALPTVFEMFRQANGPNRSQGGLGIGLTLAKQFVELHGGTIEAHSVGEHHGADFVIRLPLAPAAGRPDDTRATTVRGEAACLRVLVVDDNVDLVEMLGLVVETFGHRVRKAFDGRSAISAALEYRPHVVLLDVGMPGMSGIEVAQELRRHPEMAGTRIVALTGWGQPEDRRRTAEAGFDDHVTKPADPQHLQRLLERFAAEASQ